MPNFVKKIIQKAQNNLKDVFFEGVVFAVFLGFFALIISANIIRVFTNGKSNYETFANEQADLAKMQDKNQSLQTDYNYYTSDEYKQLLLRDAQNLGKIGEDFFTSKEKPQYFQEKPEYLSVKDKKDFTDWWTALVR